METFNQRQKRILKEKEKVTNADISVVNLDEDSLIGLLQRQVKLSVEVQLVISEALVVKSQKDRLQKALEDLLHAANSKASQAFWVIKDTLDDATEVLEEVKGE